MHGFASERRGFASERHGFASERHGFASERHGLASEKLRIASEKLGFATEKLGFALEKLGFASEKHGLCFRNPPPKKLCPKMFFGRNLHLIGPFELLEAGFCTYFSVNLLYVHAPGPIWGSQVGI